MNWLAIFGIILLGFSIFSASLLIAFWIGVKAARQESLIERPIEFKNNDEYETEDLIPRDK